MEKNYSQSADTIAGIAYNSENFTKKVIEKRSTEIIENTRSA